MAPSPANLAGVAAFAGASEDEVVALHSGVTYRVYLIGFVPGLPYLARVESASRPAAPDDAENRGADVAVAASQDRGSRATLPGDGISSGARG